MINRLYPDFTDLPGRRDLPRNYKRVNSFAEHIDVSIITPYYNTEDFFVETFVSLQAQSLQNWEWVICDDGSTDQESVNRLAEVAAKDERITVIRQKNAGPGAARNTAFHKVVGRYVCLLDSDDMLEPTFLEKCVWFLDSNQEFAFCNSYNVVFGEQEHLWTSGFERGKAYLQANSAPPFSVIRRSAYADCGGFDESIRFGHEDWDFWLAMAKAGHWGYTIPEFLQWYRKRGSGRFEQIMRSGSVHDEFEKMISRKYAGLDKHFPEPSRHHPQPYETIETTALVTNPLAANPSGRRIMFMIPWMVTGGADRVNLDLIEGLAGKGHDITVCATLLADHCWEHEFSRFTPDIFILPNILNPSDYPRFLAYLIQSRQIDTVVITGSTIGYQLLPYLRAVSAGVAFVDLCHVEEPHWLNGGHPRFGVGYQDVLDLNIVTTQHLSDWMQERGADDKRIRTMYTGVRPSAQATQLANIRGQMLAELNIPDNEPVIVFAGRICEQKRPTMLVEILKKARDHGLLFRALIIGDGEQRGQLEALLGQYHLTTRVQMLGSVSHQRWLDILVVSNILLMPSQYEGISIALLEAIAAGVVPVVAEVGGQNEIVSSDAGVLIPHGANEIEEYFDAICRLLSNTAELQRMSKQCKAIAASKLSWEGMIDNFLAVLDEAHQLRVGHPRYLISPKFGRELVYLSMRDGHIANYNQAVDERDGQIVGLNQTIAEREWHIAELRAEIVSHEEWALKQDQQLKIAQAQYAQMVTSASWRISLPLREVKRFFIFSPEQQAKRYVKGSLRLVSRLYRALPLSFQTKEAHRNVLAKYLPRRLLVSGSHPATIPDLAGSGVDSATHYLSNECHESHICTLPELDICGDYELKPDRETMPEMDLCGEHSKLPDDFDPDVYLKLHPDVAAAGVDPATHYLSHGCHESRIYTLPVLDIFCDYELKPDRETMPEMDLCGEHSKLPDDFDPDVYLKLHPDVAAAGVDPATHYLSHGCHESRIYTLPVLDIFCDYELKPDRETMPEMDLCGEHSKLPDDFDPDVYLKLHPDVAAAGVDPATHYLSHGCHESRIYTLPVLDIFGDYEFKPDREAIPEMDLCGEHGKLPDNFDPEVYLKLHPDVAAAGVDPATHYLSHGCHESRIYTLPVLDICGDYEFKPDCETVLVVSHEASRTGAPILSLNLVKALVEHYNVVALLLGGGPLSEAFKLSGAAVIESFHLRGDPVLANDIVSQLCARFNFKFALINSIESRAVLPPLGNYFVPAISLIHEFASYIRPRGAFRDALFWSGEVVFSANVTMENAFVEYPDLGDRSVHILPQGRCLLPLAGFSEEQRQAESIHIRRLIRPKGLAEGTVIVLGAGSVELRKGVDLFIECAARVVRAPDGNRCRFVWIGNGYDPDNDAGYSVYLADQVRRAGLQKHVFFLGETAAIETAYEEADLLLLSSRLDPLPGVAIEAMAHGVPVLCFNKTTGIADFLIDSGLGNDCVAGYLDTADMAEKILALMGSQVLRQHVGDQCRVASIAYFDMKEYVARLEVLAQGVCDRMEQEKADTQTILDSGLFRPDFSILPQCQNQSIEKLVRSYVRAWSSGIDRRKPFPGFHPGIYHEQHGVSTQGTDPFADYLRVGCPVGSWNYPVIVAQKKTGEVLPDNYRVALHLHVYYPELLKEILTGLSYNRIYPDLFVSVNNENDRKSVIDQLENNKGKLVDIQIVPNRGRAIGPFLTAFGQRILANYEFVGHIHTKKTVDVKGASMDVSCCKFLLENLLGGESGPMADTILAHMNKDASIGMVFPDDPYIVGWGANLAFAEPLAARMGLEKLPEHFVSPLETMFWAKTLALAPLLDLKLSWDNYPEEPLPYDGSSLHALERLFPLILSIGNFRSATTNVMGLTR